MLFPCNLELLKTYEKFIKKYIEIINSEDNHLLITYTGEQVSKFSLSLVFPDSVQHNSELNNDRISVESNQNFQSPLQEFE